MSRMQKRGATPTQLASPTAAQMLAGLKAVSSKERALALSAYFKTGPGEYGEGDVFIGVTVPQARALARRYRQAALKEVDALLRMEIHEARTLALMILCDRYERGDARTRAAIYSLYTKRFASINNWDLVDGSAPTIVGGELAKSRVRKLLGKWARAKNIWHRRIAVLATFRLIREHEFAPTLELCERLLGDPHDLMHKACGWMLREIGKRDERTLRRWLDRFATAMPRTMLRYAIERFPEPVRLSYLKRRSA